MKLIVTRYVCGNCTQAFNAPALLPGSYGEFLLRSSAGELTHLNGLEDDTYAEVSDLLEKLPKIAVLRPEERAAVLQRVFGEVACDPGPSGLPLSMVAKPPCPFCRSQRMASWEPKEPVELVEIDVPEVTHRGWSALSEDEKIAQLKRASLP